MVTPLNNAIEFLRAFGFFNVVLPFLLVFTIVFGILEKTRILGEDTGKSGDKYPKRNLNAMVAFSIAFFVIAASNIVQVIQVALPQITFLLIVIVAFLLLFGSFVGSEEGKPFNLKDMKKTKNFFMLVVFIAVGLILLGAFGYLGPLIGYVMNNSTGTFITSIIFLIIILGVMYYIIKDPSKEMRGESE